MVLVLGEGETLPMTEHGPVIVQLVVPKDPKPNIKFKGFLVGKVPTPHRSNRKRSPKKKCALNPGFT